MPLSIKVCCGSDGHESDERCTDDGDAGGEYVQGSGQGEGDGCKTCCDGGEGDEQKGAETHESDFRVLEVPEGFHYRSLVWWRVVVLMV